MSIGVLFLVQILFLILQVVLGALSIKFNKPFLLKTSYLCFFVVIMCLIIAIILN